MLETTSLARTLMLAALFCAPLACNDDAPTSQNNPPDDIEDTSPDAEPDPIEDAPDEDEEASEDVPETPDLPPEVIETEDAEEDTPPDDPEVMCGIEGSVFPDFDKGCTRDEACTIAIHQRDCCGTLDAIGIHVDEQARFDAAEEACRAMYPACGCPALPTTAEDGRNITEGHLAVSCEQNTCRTRIDPDTCDALTETMSRELFDGAPSACTVVVRFDHDTEAILSHQLVCGRYSRADEAAARATAQRDTGFGERGRMLNPPDPRDAFVFYESPGDFGGAAAVSAATGLTLFGGAIVWDGQGDINHPADWRDPSALGERCFTPNFPLDARGYDLVSGEALAEADARRLTDRVMTTVAGEAFVRGGGVFDAVVLRYPRTVGAFNPGTAEWIVLLNGGWLD